LFVRLRSGSRRRRCSGQAEAFAAELRPLIEGMQARSLSLRQMAAELTAQGIQTPRGGAWSAASVRNVLLRLR